MAGTDKRLEELLTWCNQGARGASLHGWAGDEVSQKRFEDLIDFLRELKYHRASKFDKRWRKLSKVVRAVKAHRKACITARKADRFPPVDPEIHAKAGRAADKVSYLLGELYPGDVAWRESCSVSSRVPNARGGRISLPGASRPSAIKH
jgi:hypothetical protein